MKALLGAFFIVCTTAGAARAADWLTDMAAAGKAAAEKDVPILVNFSGSDWCVWCKRLDAEVFSQAAFQDYAKERLVLLIADFPRFSRQDPKLAEANRALAERYGVEGFPTVLLLDAKGNVLARTGYRPGGAEAYVGHVKELIGAGKAAPSKG